jgi:putative hydrolase of the HAD superfamily
MVLIFDLDDTLYDESEYVRSGFRAVARWGAERYGLDADQSYVRMNELLAAKGRGRVFNDWLGGRGSVRDAIRIYRHHAPSIRPWDSALRVLDALQDQPLYLVTDGHKVVQASKLKALGIGWRFRRAYITHRYGVARAKPSPHCFALIRNRERCEWTDMVYVADDPAKDFVTLNQLGLVTVRVLTGRHREVHAKPGYDARHRIKSLDELPALLKRVDQSHQESISHDTGVPASTSRFKRRPIT